MVAIERDAAPAPAAEVESARSAPVSIRNITVAFGALEVLKNLNLEIQPSEFLVLLGSSGCGKSTLLNAIAGLQDIRSGQIWIGGKNVTWEEPKDRGIAMVFQSYALYPRLTVRENLSFGLKVAKVPKAEIERRVAEAADILQITPLLGRRPSEISGGQRQRVAMGRAIVRDVGLFLFDEPLSNLDAQLRSELRVEIKRLHQRLGATMIYVTHDQIEALTLADRIAVMKDGIIQQLDAPDEIFFRPRNIYVASFIGSPRMNFFDVTLGGTGAAPRLTLAGQEMDFSGYGFAEGASRTGAATLGLRPEHIATVGPQEPGFDVPVDLVEPMGSESVVWSRLAGTPFSIVIRNVERPKVGDTIRVSIDPALANLFDPGSGLRL